MIIYKITNTINGKIYIGQTICSLSKRWYEHCWHAGKDDLYLHRAYKEGLHKSVTEDEKQALIARNKSRIWTSGMRAKISANK